MTNEPKNATETFADAIKKATEHFNETLGEMEEKFPFLAYDDLYPEYGGRMRLNYLDGRKAWEEVTLTLVAHGYRVSLHTENATETERELDHIEKWIVIEFDEV